MNEQTEAQKRLAELKKDFHYAGFTEKQAAFLIHLLNDFIPLI